MTDTSYVASDAAQAALHDVDRRLNEVSAEYLGLRKTMSEMISTVGGLRAGAAALADIETRSAAAKSKLDRTIEDLEVTRARMTVAVADDRTALLNAANAEAEKILSDARVTHAAEGQAHLAEVDRAQRAIAALKDAVAAKQGELDRTNQAIMEARAKLGIG
jgi:chromosome segregation ATPase